MVLLPRELVGQFIDFITSVYKSDVVHQINGEEIARFAFEEYAEMFDEDEENSTDNGGT